ncbi:MAG: 4'-phosphopantetheinyl transferase superfamily protein [Emergencia sp.]|nr:4'-phosphopantetheinyl transferase superfamily protein [Emergencia sp.]
MGAIYIYEGFFERGEQGYPLVQTAAAAYAAERGMELEEEMLTIAKEEKGKPYFSHCPLEFSLSHSGELWMCLISESRCGLDLQEVKASCDVDQIAARRFTAGEQHYVSLWGEEGFFDLWVRKEAFCKCTGQGIFTKMPEMVDSEMELLPQVIWQDKTYYFQEIQISPEIKCAVCTEGQTEEIEMRLLG